MQFTVTMKITSKPDGGGGVTLADAEDAVAGKLGLLACRAARS